MKDEQTFRKCPLYVRLEQDLKSQITSGELNIGDKLGSHKSLSSKYGVSIITVKQALKRLKDAGFIDTQPGRGSFVVRQTSRIDPRDHPTIGLVISKLDDPFFATLVEAIEKEAHDASYNVLLSMTASRENKAKARIEYYRDLGADGLVITSFDKVHKVPPVVKEIHGEGFPYVMISYVADDDIYCVNTNHEEGAYLATDHLLKNGYTRIGYVGTTRYDLLNLERKKGYLRALSENGIALDKSLIFDRVDESGWRRYPSSVHAGKYLAALPDRPEAVVAFNDLVAAGIMQGLQEEKLNVPDDMAIVGFDGIEFFRSSPFNLTTVVQPIEQLGQKIFEILVRQIQGENPPFRTLLKPSLYIGASSGCTGEMSGMLPTITEKRHDLDAYQGILNIG